MLRAISFDIWGTLIDLEGALRMASEYIAGRLGLPPDEAHRRVMEAHAEARELRRAKPIGGKETIEAAQGILAAKLGASREIVAALLREAFQAMDARGVVYEDVLEPLERLREEGVVMGVVGNVLFWPSSYTWSLLERSGLSRYFAIRLFSDEFGRNKPDREVFLAFLERARARPSEAAHVGDNVVEDVGGPLGAGMRAVLIDRGRASVLVEGRLGVAVINDMRLLPPVLDLLLGGKSL